MKMAWSALSRWTSAAAVVLLGGAIGAERAHAAGVEETVSGGAVAMGRQAAYVRADDYMAVWQNPANLALLGSKDLGAELRFPVMKACFDRVQNPNYNYLPTESFDKVCNDGAFFPSGSLGFAMPLPRGFGFGVGVFTPGGQPNMRFGHADVNTINVNTAAETIPGTTGVRETPGRYMLINREAAAAFLMAGVGYAPMPQLRFGLSAGAGFSSAKFRNVNSVTGGSLTDSAVVADVSAVDMFVPRATLSVAATPLDSLDLMATFTYNGDTSADGSVTFTGNGIKDAPLKKCSDMAPGPRCEVDDVTLKVPYQRFEVVLGARYAQRRNKRERVLNPMKDEVWDIELNGYWVQTSHVDKFTLLVRDADERQGITLASSPTASVTQLPQTATLFHGWKDTYGVRLGGDYNVLEDLLAVRAGVGFETRGVPKEYMNLDYWPVRRVTVSLGATVKYGRYKLHAAYAHVFNETVDVKPGEGNLREVVALNSQAAQVINEGKYSSGLNVFSLQGNVSF